MANRVWGILLAIIVVGVGLASADCVLGPNRYYGVMSNRGNRIFIRHDRWYYVGKLPEDWENMKTAVRSASWYNPAYLSSISTQVMCDMSVSGRPLKVVASDVAGALSQRTVTDIREFMLDGRGARRQKVTGQMDGVPLAMDVVVVKKNNCSFDFIAVAPPEQMAAVQPFFEMFFQGFRFGEGTKSPEGEYSEIISQDTDS